MAPDAGQDIPGTSFSRPQPDNPSQNNVGVCRICLETSPVSDLDRPCNCRGSIGFAHRACTQRWLLQRHRPDLDVATCELCTAPFRGPYTYPSPVQQAPRVLSNLLSTLLLTATPVEPLVLPTEHRLGYPAEEARRSQTAATLCVTAVLALVGMLLVRHVLLGVHALGTLTSI